MITQEFAYEAPASLAEALDLLSHDGAKPLAGGMSLIPMMKLRLAAPEQLIDIGRLQELKHVLRADDFLHIGAGVTHWEVEKSAVIRELCPLLVETVSNIGDIQVRNRGTIGGSAAHADPSADYPAAFFALEAQFRVVKKGGSRMVGVEDFFVDMLTTSLEPGEVIAEIVVPVEKPGTGVSYQKCLQPASGYALVGVAARVGADFVRIGVTGLSGKAYRAHAAEAEYLKSRDAAKAAALVAEGVDANTDIHASAHYRAHLASVYAKRALLEAASRMS
jgi:carbon-monoxide dehydrogenase medium subunit